MILVVDMNWKPESLAYYEFVLPILAVAQKLEQCTVKHYRDVSKQDLTKCDKVILSGTTLEDNGFLSESERFLWLKETRKPVLGICAGMEAIGKVFGAKLTPSLEVGMTQISTFTENPLFSGEFRAYSLHTLCVEATGQFEVWAKSVRCIQAIKHKTQPVIGVLFHPEVRNREVIQRFLVEKT
jgi:GMP synthase-like glutamine amidotransferase